MALAGAYKLFDQDNDVVKTLSTISSGIWSSGGKHTYQVVCFSHNLHKVLLLVITFLMYIKQVQTDSEAEIQFSLRTFTWKWFQRNSWISYW